jgi:S1-C subfamily serine protease
MKKTIKTIIKNNKMTILVSVVASTLTILILTATLSAILINRAGSLNNAIISLTGQSKTTTVDSSVEQSSVINAVEKANSAVISIIITKDVPIYEQYYQQYNPFGNLFGGTAQKQTGTQPQEVGGGSGFLVSADGYIVTNNHVVEDTTASYTVITNDGTKYDAKVLAKDSVLDVAVLKIEGNGFKFLTFADSDKLKLGQSAIAIGNALAEFQNSISLGIISGLSRSITAGTNQTGATEQLDNVIQTDAAINPGNSGGPLLDINGNVIGVNVAVESNANSIGFALPSNMVKMIADSVMKNGEIVRPYIGIRYLQINDTIKKSNNLSVDYGILVARGATTDELAVIPGSPADKAGIIENDIILEIDGVKLDSTKTFASIIRQKQVEQTVKLKIIHKVDEKEVEVKLAKAPSDN